ncbi:cupin domain-containing protein, partial [Candidatus Gracilibacteria bacterium]|nr:cupin domain-containing protein [Candidatus Gracilibacteria bacterium]
MIEQLAPPGFTTPLHVHYGEDEAMFIIEGSCTFFVGDQVLRAGPGAFVYLPRAVPRRHIEHHLPAEVVGVTAGAVGGRRREVAPP